MIYILAQSRGIGDTKCIHCCLSSLSEESTLFLTTLAGVDRSDCENWIKICIRIVTTAKATAENVKPFHDENSEKRWITFKVPKISTMVQEQTTCFYITWADTDLYLFKILYITEQENYPSKITRRDFTGRTVSCSCSPNELSASCLSSNLSW